MDTSGGESLKTIALQIQQLIENEQSGALVVVIASDGSAPGKPGAKMLVLPDGTIHGTIGGGVIEARVMADALKAIEDGHGPRTLRYKLDKLGMSCGGDMTIYIEPMLAPRRVIIYGAGHVGAAVANMLKRLGCTVTVVDEREEWASRERMPDVDQIVRKPYAEHLAVSPPSRSDHVIIVTRGHEYDQLVLEATVELQPAYLGLMGSKKKAEHALGLLRTKGVDEALIQRVRTPIGLEIGAVTPEEIAISIAAELIALWRKGESRAVRGEENRVGRDGPTQPGLQVPPPMPRPGQVQTEAEFLIQKELGQAKWGGGQDNET